jgi:cytidine deaminase
MQTNDPCLISGSGPYSLFRVGCSILLEDGSIVQGANVENAAYPVGTCAERVAIGTAVVQARPRTRRRELFSQLTASQGAKKGDFRAIAVATDIAPPASPCGMCRQFIREFCEVRVRSIRLIRAPSVDSIQA